MLLKFLYLFSLQVRPNRQRNNHQSHPQRPGKVNAEPSGSSDDEQPGGDAGRQRQRYPATGPAQGHQTRYECKLPLHIC